MKFLFDENAEFRIANFLRSTGNLKLAQTLAGHADIGTTANIYAHLDTSDLETALRALNEETTCPTGIVPTGKPDLQGRWRRRESNPRRRPASDEAQEDPDLALADAGEPASEQRHERKRRTVSCRSSIPSS